MTRNSTPKFIGIVANRSQMCEERVTKARLSSLHYRQLRQDLVKLVAITRLGGKCWGFQRSYSANIKGAALYGDIDVVRYLVEHGADVDAVDCRGRRALKHRNRRAYI